ncbi:MAG: hypothetical protein IID44_25185 [Planctomycetes bacterium]|nr:hypothetical protein [Planctomycetota bacterium]
MAALLVEARRPDEAAGFYARLLSDPELAGAVCLDGKTGRELADALAKNSPVRRYLGSAGVWPRGAVTHDAKRLSGIRQPSLARSYHVKMRGDPGPFFTETTAYLDPDRRTLSARDANGSERWRISLAAEERRSGFGYPMIALDSYCAARGHLLLFSSRNSIYAIDTLRASAQPSGQSGSSETLPPAVLWRQERNERIPGVSVGQGYRAGLSFGRYYGSIRENRRVSALGPVTDHGVCFQRVGELVCVDPLTGQTQWVRRGLPKKCELFGDEELLFVVPPGSKTARVFRSADGKLLGEREVPRRREWIAAIGRYLLTKMVTDDGELVIDMIDPWKEDNRERWPLLSFSADSKYTLVGRDALAVLEPNGHFVIHALEDRRLLVEAHVEVEEIDSIYVIPSRERYLLVVNRPLRGSERDNRVTAAPSGSDINLKMLNARVYAFDRVGGKQRWPAAARVEQFGLLLHQPRELPVFVVARQVKLSGSRIACEVLCIDKRSGRLVYRSPAFSKPITNYTIAGDPSQRAVSLVIQSGERPTYVRLVFSDQPTAPDPPYQGNQSVGPPSQAAQKFKGAGDDPFSEEGSGNPFSEEDPEDDD